MSSEGTFSYNSYMLYEKGSKTVLTTKTRIKQRKIKECEKLFKENFHVKRKSLLSFNEISNAVWKQNLMLYREAAILRELRLLELSVQ